MKKWNKGDDIFLLDNGEKYYGKVVSDDGVHVIATFGTDEPIKHLKKDLELA